MLDTFRWQAQIARVRKKKKMSRQRAWQVRQNAAGKCAFCNEPIYRIDACKRHYERRKAWCRNRYRAAHGIPLDAPLYSVRH